MQSEGSRSTRRWLSAAAKWGATGVLVALVVSLVDLTEVYRLLRSADPGILAGALALAVGDRLLMAGKWIPLLWIQLPGVGIGRAVRTCFAASLAALFLPPSVGADSLRAIGLGRERRAVMEVGASVVVERALGLVATGVPALLALALAIRAGVPLGVVAPWVILAAGVGLAAAIVPFHARARRGVRRLLARFQGQKWVGFAERFGAAYAAYRAHPRTLAVVGLLSVLEQFLPVFILWVAARAMALDVSLEALLVATPLALFAARLPISVAGIGVLEGGLVYLLGLFDVSAAAAVSLALAGRFLELLALLPGALWWRELAGHRGVGPLEETPLAAGPDSRRRPAEPSEGQSGPSS